MRNIFIFVSLCALAVALLAFAQPQTVAKPVKDGAGPLAVKIDSRLVAPDYHSPLESWRTHHIDTLNGGDLGEAQCLNCHEPLASCNNCHRYVGVRTIVAPLP